MDQMTVVLPLNNKTVCGSGKMNSWVQNLLKRT